MCVYVDVRSAIHQYLTGGQNVVVAQVVAQKNNLGLEGYFSGRQWAEYGTDFLVCKELITFNF